MKTPEEIKLTMVRLAGVAECLEKWTHRYAYAEYGEFEAFLRAAKYVREGQELIAELSDRAAGKEVGKAFEAGSLVAKAEQSYQAISAQHNRANCHPPGGLHQCQVMNLTDRGARSCPNVATQEKRFPDGEAFAGMYGAQLILRACDSCAKKTIRWTLDAKPYGVD